MNRFLAVAAIALSLGACSYGQPVDRQQTFFATMHDGIGPIGRYAAMTAISPDWALTNDHADGIAAGLAYEAPQADLALVRLPNHDGEPLPRGDVAVGGSVHLYGSGSMGDQRVAHGTVLDTKAFICWGKPRAEDADNACKAAGYGIEWAMVITGTAGGGYSGGPVTNDAGELVGITAREFHPVGGFVGASGISEGSLVATQVPEACDGEDLFLVYPIDAALREFFPDGDPNKAVLADARPAEPSSWFERWGWVALLLI